MREYGKLIVLKTNRLTLQSVETLFLERDTQAKLKNFSFTALDAQKMKLLLSYVA